MKKMKSILIIALAAVMSLTCFTGCGQTETATTETIITDTQLASGGVICLKVNPEIAVSYDDNGNVTAIDARNDDGSAIIADYSGYEGKPAKDVVKELVTAIGAAGYFVDDVDGGKRTITIEIEAGSKLPNDTFLDDIANEIRNCVNENKWHTPVDLVNESDYGMTNYIDTDYGTGNDGNTDYGNDTDYGTGNDGVTDYNNSAYGSSTGGNTNYDDTDYGPNNDGVTDYNDTDYGPNNDGVTDYNDTDYGPNNDGVTDYNDTDYGPNNDGVTDYNDSAYGGSTGGSSGGNTNYSNYGSGSSGNSSYGDSAYGD